QLKDVLIGYSAGLRLSWPIGDTVNENKLMSLVGKTLYFDDTLVHPELSFNTDNTNDPRWYSVDTPDHNFKVKINNISYVKDEYGLTFPLKIYVISGTCNGTMGNYNNNQTASFSNGDFNFLISMP